MNAHCVAALTTPPLGDSRRAAEAGPRQLSQQVVRHPPPVLSELGCPALCTGNPPYSIPPYSSLGGRVCGVARSQVRGNESPSVRPAG